MIETLQAEHAALVDRAEVAEAETELVQARLAKIEKTLARFRTLGV